MKSNPTLQVAATYVGAIIGAGFASGQELVQFFVLYGKKGLLGILLTGLLFALLGILVVDIIYKSNYKTSEDFFVKIFGKKFGSLVEMWITITLFLGLSVMFAGCGSMFKEQLGIPFLVGMLFSAGIIFFVLLEGEKGLLKFNMNLIPILLIIVLIITIPTIFFAFSNVTTNTINPLIGKSFIKSALLYTAFNSILGTVVLSSLSFNKIGRKKIRTGSILGGFTLSFIGFLMIFSLLLNFSEISTKEIPMLFLAGQLNSIFLYLYMLVLWFAMLTTAAANAFCLLKKFTKKINYKKPLPELFIILSSLPIALFGFKKLIYYIYPFMGYGGLVIVFAIVIKYIQLNIAFRGF